MSCPLCKDTGWVDCTELPGFCVAESHGGPCSCPAGRELVREAEGR